SAQIREILINESAWEEMTCLFALSLTYPGFRKIPTDSNVFYQSVYNAVSANQIGLDTRKVSVPGARIFAFLKKAG
ncbi:hypothetical protein JZ087_26950, partial [Klebsiella pneumoniae]|nr:hypothetical protein [Klebsiella pneumoniae]MBN7948217.1 hypothetical protein [Klebsiella pneumoniae]MBN7959224.1 hypothetical protein [Klebsiella pneumoniae]MBN7964578.1 hypothetical protein [Klebsiella pneumoniae]MBN8014413.1 hypothetical protein [Klebsiella pneumoniae]